MRNGGGGGAAAAATPVAGLSIAPWRLAQMGKASRWLRNLFLPGWKSRKAKDRGATDADCQSVLSAPLPTATPAGREKRRWSFRRPGAGASGGAQGQGPLASSSSHCFSEAEVHVVVVAQEQEQDHQQQVAAAVVPEAASSNEVSIVVPLPASSGRRSGAGARDRDGVAATAAVKIQAAFRSYLARKALCALRGMVRLQAMARGQLVRRQANLTLRRMQALVHAQRRARAERLRLLDVEDGASSRHQPSAATPRPAPSRRSPQHPARSRKPPEAAERGSEEHDVRIVEVDDSAARAATRRNSNSCLHYSTSATTPSRITPAKAEDPCQRHVSPTTPSSARTDASGRFDVDDASFTSASEPTPTPVPPGRRRAWRPDPQSFPSYMANTESSRAKARSQSAPRQRLSSVSEPAAASPSPSCWERPPSRGGGGSGVPRRASLDPMDLPGGGAPPSRRVERCASRARASTTMSSVPGSECGSSSTVGHRGKSRMGHSHGTGDY